MYSRICNPKTGRWVNLNGPLGKKILNNYFITQTGGAGQAGLAGHLAGIKAACLTEFDNGEDMFYWNCPLDNEPQRTELEEAGSCDELTCDRTGFELEGDEGILAAEDAAVLGEGNPLVEQITIDNIVELKGEPLDIRTTWNYEGSDCTETFIAGLADSSIHFKHGDEIWIYGKAGDIAGVQVDYPSVILLGWNRRLGEFGMIDEMYLQYKADDIKKVGYVLPEQEEPEFDG
jgi:hypothetical protein